MKKIAIITGSAGLIGTEASEFYIRQGYVVVGIDNDMRRTFFGDEATTAPNQSTLANTYPDEFIDINADIRDADRIDHLFRKYNPEVIIHTAAQPSHDWAARDPHTDFDVNARGTLNMLEAARRHACDSPFIHCSTSKVYGDNPNRLPFHEDEDRWELPYHHKYWRGIDTTMSVDNCTHSLFGVSKLAGDLLVQEYGRYFHMPTVCFRPGCLTGGNHQGTELHGFLSYLMKCAIQGRPYTIIGYKGKQVRCNVHSSDLVAAFEAFRDKPSEGAVYNIGGGRQSNCSIVEAILFCEELTGKAMLARYEPTPRIGDHQWWISDNSKFEKDYPDWSLGYDSTYRILDEIYQTNVERWTASTKE